VHSRLFPAFLLLSVVGWTAEPPGSASEYAAHAGSEDFQIGAKYLVRSFSDGSQTYFAEQFLVVETGVFVKGIEELRQSNFTLRINGKMSVVAASPQAVGYALKLNGAYNVPSLSRPKVLVSGGIGDANVTAGPTYPGPRFPGDRRAIDPTLAKIPDPNRAGIDPIEKDTASSAAPRVALPEGAISTPQHGYLFFPYAEKLKHLKKLELLYKDTKRELVLPLI
jgi:hypothetical protein